MKAKLILLSLNSSGNQVPTKCSLKRLLAVVSSPQWYCDGACKCKRNNSSVGKKRDNIFGLHQDEISQKQTLNLASRCQY